MSNNLDFLLKPTPDRLRKEIMNICDSYSHPWDVLAELCQNSVDAIHAHLRQYGETAKHHRIDISLDAAERSIIVRDTGMGFHKEKFVNLLAPHGTDKDTGDLSNIGQKGVGLTYVIFSSDAFDIETKSLESHVKGSIRNAVLWKNKKVEEPPQFAAEVFVDEKCEPEETFTQIRMFGLEDIFEEDEDIFNQTAEVLEFIIRTRTAVGSTRGTFENEQEKMSVSLFFTNKDLKKTSREIKPAFMWPEDFLASSSSYIDYDDFVQLAATLDDRQKTQKLQGKGLRKKGSITRAGRDIKYYAFFAPSRKFWKDISERNKLTRYNPETKEDEPLYSSGIYVSSRSMPTGITLTHPSTGQAAYWPNLFILLEDSRIVFDLGRKSIPGRTQALLKEIAKERFNEFIKFRQYVTTDPATQQSITTVSQYEKSAMFEELNKLPNLNIEAVGYLKEPDSQEASVVAIFHELIGGKLLKGYRSLKHGYKETYDLWGYYDVQRTVVGKNVSVKDGVRLPIIIEFKYKAESVLFDFQDRIKDFIDVDLIVCWDIDKKKFAKEGVQVTVLNPENVLFHGSNYELEWPGSYNLGAASRKPVLSLRKFVEDIQRQK